MAPRAVIVAVEDYPKSVGLAPKLDGTLANGHAFQDWLFGKKGVATANITFLSDPTRKQIADAFRDLVDAGKDTTEELYVFFSGHGYTFNDNPFKQKPADVIVGGEFQNLQDSGDACLRLSDIQMALWRCLGPGTHYYFIDACRNLIPAGKVTPGTLGWSRDDSNLGQPRIFTLFSTERGSTAALSGFAPALVDGLTGKGRAKMRDGFEMFVTFDSLCRYLEGTLKQKIQPDPGGGTGRILQIDPIPVYRCGVHVNHARPNDVFALVVHNPLRQQIYGPQSFQGDHTDFTEGPDDYYVQVTHPQFTVVPTAPVKADLYEDSAVSFEKVDQPATAPPPTQAPLPAATVELQVPQGSGLLIRSTTTGKVTEAQNSFSGELDPGEYDVRVTERGWTSVRKLSFRVSPGDTLSLNAGQRGPTPVKDSLLASIPGQHDADRVDFSESLGPMANQDLGLWLSLIGASRIVRKWGDFSKLSSLPLVTFDDVQTGDSPTYALLGLESLPASINLAVHAPGEEPQWHTLQPVPGLNGVFEYRANRPIGLNLVSVSLPDKAPLTVVAYNLPNRATLFVVADDATNGMRIHQYVLPLAKLEQNLTPLERANQPPNPLEAIRFITLAQRQMARRRPMKPDQATTSYQEQNLWMDLLYGKWLDPVMAIMGAYELVRTNSFPMMPGGTGAIVLHNLREYFSTFPDVEVIAKLAKAPYREPERPPLFLVGLLALEHYEQRLPFPATYLDTTGPWITWLSAVVLSKVSGGVAE
jgi:hypothetical protein